MLLIELVFIGIGVIFFALGMLEKAKSARPAQRGFLTEILLKIFNEKQAAAIIPLSGFAILAAWTAVKISVYGQTDLRMEDIVLTLLGVSLLLYQTGASKYQQEKDFIVLYLMLLAIFFLVIVPLIMILTAGSYADFMRYSEQALVTNPIVFLARLFGADVFLELDPTNPQMSNYIDFYYQGRLIRLGVGITCSGIYTFGLFFSAFTAFVLVVYRKIDRYIVVALLLGAFVTWAANIFRMLIIVLVGAAYGFQALAIVHMYIGIVIFVLFASVFWLLIVRWLDAKEGVRGPPEEKPEPG